jgi:hypothetical protein
VRLRGRANGSTLGVDRKMGILMKSLIFAICAVFAFGGLSAQTPAWQPSQGHTQVPIWPGAVPDARPVTGPETIKTDTKNLVAGRPWVYINKV